MRGRLPIIIVLLSLLLVLPEMEYPKINAQDQVCNTIYVYAEIPRKQFHPGEMVPLNIYAENYCTFNITFHFAVDVYLEGTEVAWDQRMVELPSRIPAPKKVLISSLGFTVPMGTIGNMEIKVVITPLNKEPITIGPWSVWESISSLHMEAWRSWRSSLIIDIVSWPEFRVIAPVGNITAHPGERVRLDLTIENRGRMDENNYFTVVVNLDGQEIARKENLLLRIPANRAVQTSVMINIPKDLPEGRYTGEIVLLGAGCCKVGSGKFVLDLVSGSVYTKTGTAVHTVTYTATQTLMQTVTTTKTVKKTVTRTTTATETRTIETHGSLVIGILIGLIIGLVLAFTFFMVRSKTSKQVGLVQELS